MKQKDSTLNSVSSTPSRLPALHLLGFLVLGVATTACDPFVRQEVDAASGQKSQVHLVRVMQQVNRYNCQGDIVSQNVEQIERPNAVVYVHPSTTSAEHVYGSHFFNRTTNADEGAVTNRIGIYVDISPSASMAMHVVEGVNTIEYHYTECLNPIRDQQSGTITSCLDERKLEDGTFDLEVTYEVKQLSGFSEVHASCPNPGDNNSTSVP